MRGLAKAAAPCLSTVNSSARQATRVRAGCSGPSLGWVCAQVPAEAAVSFGCCSCSRHLARCRRVPRSPACSKQGLFAHPPRPSEFNTRGYQLFRDLLAVQVSCLPNLHLLFAQFPDRATWQTSAHALSLSCVAACDARLQSSA